jgi:hypothetical protein
LEASTNGHHQAAKGCEAKRPEGAERREAQAHDRQPAEEHPPRAPEAGHRLEDRNRDQIYAIASKEGIEGRSRMGKWELIDAIRRKR